MCDLISTEIVLIRFLFFTSRGPDSYPVVTYISRKGIWKGNLTYAKALEKDGGTVTTLRVFLCSFP